MFSLETDNQSEQLTRIFEGFISAITSAYKIPYSDHGSIASGKYDFSTFPNTGMGNNLRIDAKKGIVSLSVRELSSDFFEKTLGLTTRFINQEYAKLRTDKSKEVALAYVDKLASQWPERYPLAKKAGATLAMTRYGDFESFSSWRVEIQTNEVTQDQIALLSDLLKHTGFIPRSSTTEHYTL